MTLKTPVLKKLARLAIGARKNAYAPYSNHPVGVALLAASGKIYVGANCETANYDGTCAETGAIAAMAAAGDRLIRAVVTVGPSRRYLCTPCGRCRQRIREFSDTETRVYSLKEDGGAGKVYTMEDLLPDAFGPDNVKQVGKRKK